MAGKVLQSILADLKGFAHESRESRMENGESPNIVGQDSVWDTGVRAIEPILEAQLSSRIRIGFGFGRSLDLLFGTARM